MLEKKSKENDVLDIIENWISVIGDKFEKLFQRIKLRDKYIQRI